MVLFFGLITKEVVEATAAGGVLHPWRRAAVPMVASLGLTLVAAGAVRRGRAPGSTNRGCSRDGRPSLRPTSRSAISRAASSSARIRRSPFFLLLALSANALGILALAALGASPAFNPGLALGFMIGRHRRGRTAAKLRGSERASPYVIGAGALSWCALYFGGSRARVRAGSRPAVRAACRARPWLLRRDPARRARSAEPVRTLGPPSHAGRAAAVRDRRRRRAAACAWTGAPSGCRWRR